MANKTLGKTTKSMKRDKIKEVASRFKESKNKGKKDDPFADSPKRRVRLQGVGQDRLDDLESDREGV